MDGCFPHNICFHLLATLKSAAVNMGVQIGLNLCSQLCVHPEKTWPDPMVSLYFVFWGTVILFSSFAIKKKTTTEENQIFTTCTWGNSHKHEKSKDTEATLGIWQFWTKEKGGGWGIRFQKWEWATHSWFKKSRIYVVGIFFFFKSSPKDMFIDFW